jgi:hypothetical protein
MARDAGPISDLRQGPGLARSNPNDIAVLPVTDETPTPGALGSLAEHFQATLYRQLIDRRYAPRPLADVNATVERERATTGTVSFAALKGKFRNEDAMLQAQVTNWDQGALISDGRIRIACRIQLLDSRTLDILWGGSYQREVKVASGSSGLEERKRQALEEFVRTMMADLPMRTVRADSATPEGR